MHASQSLKTGSPFVFINDSGGARVQEGIDSLAGYGRVFYTNVLLSGRVPQISLICGPCAGGAAYSPALTDFIIQTRRAQMFITGPRDQAGHRRAGDLGALGGADAHMAHSGVIHFIADDDEQAVLIAEKLLSFLPIEQPRGPAGVGPGLVVEPDPTPDDDCSRRSEEGLRRPRGDRPAWWIAATSWRCRRGTPPTSWSGSAGSPAARWVSSPTSPAHSPASSTSTRPTRRSRSSGSATPSTFRWSPSSTSPASCRACTGARRHHPARRQDAVRLLGRDRAEGHRGPAQGVRRRLHRDVLRRTWGPTVFAWPTAEIAVMGAEGAAEIVFRREIDAAEDQGGATRRTDRGVPGGVLQSVCRGRPGLVDDIIEPARTRQHWSPGARDPAQQRTIRPPRNTGWGPHDHAGKCTGPVGRRAPLEVAAPAVGADRPARVSCGPLRLDL